MNKAPLALLIAALLALLSSAARADDLTDAFHQAQELGTGFRQVQDRSRPGRSGAPEDSGSPNSFDRRLLGEVQEAVRDLLDNHRLAQTLAKTYPDARRAQAAVGAMRKTLDPAVTVEEFKMVHPYISQIIQDAKNSRLPENIAPGDDAAYDRALGAIRKFGAIVLSPRVPA